MPTYSSLDRMPRRGHGIGQTAPIAPDTVLLGVVAAVIGLGVLGGMMAEKHQRTSLTSNRRRRTRRNRKRRR
jgi:hypothetical protein